MIYPDLLVPDAPPHIQAIQVGNRLKISFDIPAKDLAGRKLKDNPVVYIKVMRLEEEISKDGTCSSCPSEFRLYRKIDLEFTGEGVVRIGNRLLLDDDDVEEGKRYRYRFVAYQKDDVEGRPSGILVASLVPPPQKPGLKASSSMGSVRVYIELPEFFEGDGEITSVRLSRKELIEGAQEVVVANVSPYKETFEDIGVQIGKKYMYTGRTVFRRPDGIIAESEPSNGVDIKVSDAP